MHRMQVTMKRTHGSVAVAVGVTDPSANYASGNGRGQVAALSEAVGRRDTQ